MKPIYLMMVGYSLSGKTWLVNKIIEKFPKRFFILDSRSIHDYLNRFDIFKDGNSIDGEAYKMRQETTDAIQREMVRTITRNGYSIIHDSCNSRREERVARINLVKELNPEIKTIIFFVDSDKEIVLKRAKDIDKKQKHTIWQDLHMKQREKFEIPSKEESDLYFKFTGDNLDKILKKLVQ